MKNSDLKVDFLVKAAFVLSVTIIYSLVNEFPSNPENVLGRFQKRIKVGKILLNIEKVSHDDLSL